MRSKVFLIALMFLFILSPLFAVDDDYDGNKLNPKGWWDALFADSFITYDLYARSFLVSDSWNAGGGLSLGIETPSFRFEVYGQGDYFFTPLGSMKVASKEFDLEGGISLGWKFLKFWHFDTYVACDFGYFAQFVKTHIEPDSFLLGANGLMLRPKLMTELNFGRYYGLSIGVFYQFVLYPSYDRYNGVGIMFSFI